MSKLLCTPVDEFILLLTGMLGILLGICVAGRLGIPLVLAVLGLMTLVAEMVLVLVVGLNCWY